MSIRHHLRSFRKQTNITQSDISFLMNQPDYSNISRCEKGKRKPTIEMLLTYQMLFNVPITALTEHLMDDLKEDLIFRMGLLIRELELVDPTSKVNSRIAFLTSALARLSA